MRGGFVFEFQVFESAHAGIHHESRSSGRFVSDFEALDFLGDAFFGECEGL